MIVTAMAIAYPLVVRILDSACFRQGCSCTGLRMCLEEMPRMPLDILEETWRNLDHLPYASGEVDGMAGGREYRNIGPLRERF